MSKTVVLLSTLENLPEVIEELKDVLLKENILIKLVTSEDLSLIMRSKNEK